MTVLELGSNGEDVARIQQKLGLLADGIFGAETEQSVRAWQITHGLNADGIVGQLTWSSLFPDSSNEQGSGDGLVPTAGTEIKLDNLTGHIPDVVIQQIPYSADEFKLSSVLRLAHFLAQCAYESCDFTLTEEELNFSAGGLRNTFPHYFPGDLADTYAHQPEKIASRVYADRMGNRNEASRDGYTFRGRGYIQLTGKDNYAAFGQTVQDDIMGNPDLVASKYPLLSAAWFWDKNSLNTIADQGASDAVVTEITKRVNGGTNGLGGRIKKFKIFYSLLAE